MEAADSSGNEFILERTLDVNDGTPPEILSIDWVEDGGGVRVYVDIEENRDSPEVYLKLMNQDLVEDTLEMDEEEGGVWSVFVPKKEFHFIVEVIDEGGNMANTTLQNVDLSFEDNDNTLLVLILIFTVFILVISFVFGIFFYLRRKDEKIAVNTIGTTERQVPFPEYPPKVR
jgi:hypothetical protein